MAADPRLILESLSRRTKNRSWGIGRASSYIRSLEGCFEEGGFCPRPAMGNVSLEEWQAGLKDSESRLVYTEGPLQIKGSFEPSSSESLIEFECVVTSTRKDRDGDVLETRGAILDPGAPLLWQHDPFHPIGRVLRRTGQSDSRLSARCAIANFEGDGELAKMARDAATLVKFGALRISHGFDPKEFEPLDEREGRWRVTQFEIMEVSLVSVPSNTDAIITAFSQGKLHSAVMKGWAGRMFKERPVQVAIPADAFVVHEAEPGGIYEHVEGQVKFIEPKKCSCQEKASEKAATKVQSVLIPTAKFSRAEAVKWIEEHDFKNGGIDETDNYFRFRQFDPDHCSTEPRTITLSAKEGIKAVICVPKEKDATMDTKRPETEDTPGPIHSTEEEGRYRGQGAQQGDTDFDERYASERVDETADGTLSSGSESTNPRGSTMSDEAGRVATGASGATPTGSAPLPEGTNTPGKSKEGIDRMDEDEAEDHDTEGNVDETINIRGLKEVARKIQHSGKAGMGYLHKAEGMVHHVAHPDDFAEENEDKYHSRAEIKKMYKAVAGIKGCAVGMSKPGKGYEMFHDGKKDHQPTNKAGRVVSSKNMEHLTEARTHLDHMQGLGKEHVSSIAKAHVQAAHSHIVEVIKAASSMDPDGDGSYSGARVPADDAASSGTATHFSSIPNDGQNAGNRNIFKVDAEEKQQNPDMTAGVDTNNIPESIGTDKLIAQFLLVADEIDTPTLINIRATIDLVIKTAQENEARLDDQLDSLLLDSLIADPELAEVS